MKTLVTALFDVFGATEETKAAADVLLPAPAPALRRPRPRTTPAGRCSSASTACASSATARRTPRPILNAVRVAADAVEADLVGALRTAVGVAAVPRPTSGSFTSARTRDLAYTAGPYGRRDPRGAVADGSPGRVRAHPGPPGRHPGDRPRRHHEGDSFADDLDADSLALIELVEALEEELSERSVGFRIDDEDLEDLKTVRDAVDYVVAKLGA